MPVTNGIEWLVLWDLHILRLANQRLDQSDGPVTLTTREIESLDEQET
jgi:hypothetical protein